MTRPVPLSLAAVTVAGFRGWRGRKRLSLEGGLTLLVGPNGSGKSSFVNAIEWCLFGAQVARKSSGLDERADWEVSHREVEGGAVEVALDLRTEEGLCVLTRSRAAGARSRDPDDLRLELPAGDTVAGEAVQEWIEANGLPDWSTWRHAFCQHQEQPRTRVTHAADRSVQLGRLLGLDDYRATGERIKGLRFADLASRSRTEFESIENELQRSLERPGRELRELEQRIERHGVARSEVTGALLAERTRALVEDGRRIATEAQLAEPVPDPATARLAEVLRWAHDWGRLVQGRRRELERERGVLAMEVVELEAAVEGIEPARRRREDAREACLRWGAEHGSRENLERDLKTLRREREAVRERERERDRALALRRSALELLDELAQDDACPVCEQAAPALRAQLRQRLERDGEDTEPADRARALAERERSLQRQVAQLAALESDRELADAEYARLAERLEGRLPEPGAGEVRPGERVRAQRRLLRDLDERLEGMDTHLARHKSDTELVELLSKWQAARARAEAASSDLSHVEAWRELELAVDEAARLAVDLDALGAMAREVQEERSAERVREVNRTLGEHYGRITGRAEDGAVRVRVKRAATRLSYELVDAEGRNLTPVLNQAALNALSLAILFAQAEERARRELPQWLVLDDPGQSLDKRGAEGLARALCELSPAVPVLVATFPGDLADALSRPGRARRTFAITTDDAGHGVDVEETTR